MSGSSLVGLRRALEAYCKDLARQSGPAQAGLELIVAEFSGLGPPEPVRAQGFPQVDRYMPMVTQNPPPGARGDLLSALAEALPLLAWGEARIYGDSGGDPVLDAFYDGYAFCQLVGPPFANYRSPWSSERIRLGVTLQGPGIYYSAHAHPAQEIYVVIGGSGEWRQGERPWTAHPHDRVIFHEHHEPHAMRTFEAPLLALFAWPNEIESVPVLADHDWTD